MNKSNNLQTRQNKMKFSVAITTETYQNLIKNTLGDPEKAKRFIATISSSVAVNPALQECDAGSILSAALLGESLNLSPSPQLGQFYLVPFKQKAKVDREGNILSPEMVKAQFILGYKGYIQLAIRSGYYKKLNVIEIKEGELIKYDPLNEEIECIIIDDFEEREKAPTIGYYAMFEYTNGFVKTLYWSKQKMLSHADKYSQAFSATAYEKILNGKIPDKDMWKYSSFWYKNFDDMAKKTLLRQIISRWGIMSIEMQNAFDNDNSFVSQDQKGNFVSELPTSDDSQIIKDIISNPESIDTVEQIKLDELEDD